MKLIDLDGLNVGLANPANWGNRAYADGWNSLYTILQQAPVVDAEPVRRGRWVYGDDVDIQCSACGADALNETGYSLQVKSNYCPNCGAKMDGGLPNNLGREDGGAENG